MELQIEKIANMIYFSTYHFFVVSMTKFPNFKEIGVEYPRWRPFFNIFSKIAVNLTTENALVRRLITFTPIMICHLKDNSIPFQIKYLSTLNLLQGRSYSQKTGGVIFEKNCLLSKLRLKRRKISNTYFGVFWWSL